MELVVKGEPHGVGDASWVTTRTVSLLVSMAAHLALLLVLAETSVTLVTHSAAPIAVTILQAAPPPPPLGGGGARTAPAPVVPAPVSEAPVPQPVRPKIARHPPHTRPAPAPVPVQHEAPASETREGVGSPAGAAGGVFGGVPGGQVGGIVGGQGDEVVPADRVATQPQKISGDKPQYPPLARVRGVEGLVVVTAIIDREGHVEADGLAAVESLPLLDAAAIEAVRQWRFTPGRDAAGRSVRVRVRIPIRFQLR